jgi:endonuclease/exonuclease/phosphatase family metal-dependent hydrolase
MKKQLLLLPLVLLFVCKEHVRPASAPASPPYTVDTLTVMSWNVEALFDLVDDGSEFPEYKPDPFNWNADMHRRKLENTASVIAAAAPDIAVLCEVENENVTAELQSALRKSGHPFPYHAIGSTPNPTNTCPVVISRFPIRSTLGHGIPQCGRYSTRNILEADIAVGHYVLKIFAMHWPSKSHEEEDRVAVATVLAARLSELAPHTDYLLMGDFNTDYDDAEKVFTVNQTVVSGTVGMPHLLHTVRSAPCRPVEYVTESNLISSVTSGSHYDPWLELPDEHRFCYRFKGRNSTLDHILLPAALYDSIGLSYLDNSFSVFTWNGRLLVDGAPFRWKLRRDRSGFRHVGEGYSDHLPIMARLYAGPFSFASAPRGAPEVDEKTATRNKRPSTGLCFERGFDGWIVCDRSITLMRDSTTAAEGACALRIEGWSDDNCTAARVRLVPGTLGLGKGTTVSLRVKGSGKWAMRVRPAQADSGDWRYYFWNGAAMTAAGRPKYVPYSSNRWETIRLTVAGANSDTMPIDIELRIGKNMPLRLWIDGVSLSP